MSNELITKDYEGIGVVFKYIDGVSYVRIDEVARFCGWVDNSKIATSGAQLSKIRWARVNKYLNDLGFDHECTKGDFIPEYIMYPLIGKAKNDRATKFSLWVGKVLVEIRTKGYYSLRDEELEQYKSICDEQSKQIEEANIINKQQQKEISRLETYIGLPDRAVKRYTKYIKNKLGIQRKNKTYEMVVKNLFDYFEVDKWEEISLLDKEEVFDKIDEYCDVVIKYKQMEFKL